MHEVVVVSYPKCGRTWLRLMLGRLFSLHFGLNNMDVLELQEMALQSPTIPNLIFSHDGPANLMTAEELLADDKQGYANKRVVLLVRDPADVVVSYYFEYTRRRTVFNPAQFNPFDGNISAFLRQERGGLDSILAFYQNWAERKHVPASFLWLFGNSWGLGCEWQVASLQVQRCYPLLATRHLGQPREFLKTLFC